MVSSNVLFGSIPKDIVHLYAPGIFTYHNNPFGFYKLNEYGSSEKYMVPEEIDFAE